MNSAWERVDWQANTIKVTSPKTSFSSFVIRTRLKYMRTQFSTTGRLPWRPPFHAMRKTRPTELADRFPAHTVCGWLGNSEAVARAFYLQVTDEHFTKAAQNPAQQTSASPESDGNDSQADSTTNEETPVLQGLSVGCDSVRISKVDDIGLEPTTSTMSTWRSNQLS